jgi:hypothetical protein
MSHCSKNEIYLLSRSLAAVTKRTKPNFTPHKTHMSLKWNSGHNTIKIFRMFEEYKPHNNNKHPVEYVSLWQH